MIGIANKRLYDSRIWSKDEYLWKRRKGFVCKIINLEITNMMLKRREQEPRLETTFFHFLLFYSYIHFVFFIKS